MDFANIARLRIRHFLGHFSSLPQSLGQSFEHAISALLWIMHRVSLQFLKTVQILDPSSRHVCCRHFGTTLCIRGNLGEGITLPDRACEFECVCVRVLHTLCTVFVCMHVCIVCMYYWESYLLWGWICNMVYKIETTPESKEW